jgi:hypothetical protein
VVTSIAKISNKTREMTKIEFLTSIGQRSNKIRDTTKIECVTSFGHLVDIELIQQSKSFWRTL